MTEHLFQQIWSGLYFKNAGLQTTCGKNVAVIKQGVPNDGDGPDFIHAEIQIDGLSLFGDVELHLQPADWFNHGHHRDSRYNRVVLHVTLSGKPRKAATLPDGTTVPCLELQPYISHKLCDILHYARKKQEMACSGMLHLISPLVIEKQIDKAHKAYFDYRTEQLMRFYNPSLPPSMAWQRMLVTGLFEGLGFSRNKAQMVELCNLFFSHLKGDESLNCIKKKALELSGLATVQRKAGLIRQSWDYSASRPANQPPIRIDQAACLYHKLNHVPVENWLYHDHYEIWKHLMKSCWPSSIGSERRSILYNTIYLPALYILGTLLHQKELKSIAYTSWMEQQVNLPASIQNVYKKSGFPNGDYQRKLGAVYQYKYQCRESRCATCFVMQKLLQA